MVSKRVRPKDIGLMEKERKTERKKKKETKKDIAGPTCAEFHYAVHMLHLPVPHTEFTLIHTATHCNALQHTAAHCNTLWLYDTHTKPHALAHSRACVRALAEQTHLVPLRGEQVHPINNTDSRWAKTKVHPTS